MPLGPDPSGAGVRANRGSNSGLRKELAGLQQTRSLSLGAQPGASCLPRQTGNPNERLAVHQGAGTSYLLCPTWEILSPPSDLVRAPNSTSPIRLGLLVFSIRLGPLVSPIRLGTLVSLSDARERIHHPSKALQVLLPSTQGASPGLPRGKLRHRGGKQPGPGKLRCSPFPFVPSAPAPPAPCALGNSPGTGRRGILRPLRAGCRWPRVKVLCWPWGEAWGGSEAWRPHPARGLPGGQALWSGGEGWAGPKSLPGTERSGPGSNHSFGS